MTTEDRSLQQDTKSTNTTVKLRIFITRERTGLPLSRTGFVDYTGPQSYKDPYSLAIAENANQTTAWHSHTPTSKAKIKKTNDAKYFRAWEPLEFSDSVTGVPMISPLEKTIRQFRIRLSRSKPIPRYVSNKMNNYFHPTTRTRMFPAALLMITPNYK